MEVGCYSTQVGRWIYLRSDREIDITMLSTSLTPAPLGGASWVKSAEFIKRNRHCAALEGQEEFVASLMVRNENGGLLKPNSLRSINASGQPHCS